MNFIKTFMLKIKRELLKLQLEKAKNCKTFEFTKIYKSHINQHLKKTNYNVAKYATKKQFKEFRKCIRKVENLEKKLKELK